ncbi:MAG: bifunctional phosphopantothenoylcysteine decarboxylase/phosphopantothenate--cysteine ligase CoaBC [Saprospirales bacterium]|nr:MAG: bifunctional phosphopantothenoylcysteine decarboxylase/phosphopantothenate--cysteine ligase CoaBC [Saprospirales bacterium]
MKPGKGQNTGELAGKKILLGICGSIAAYKAAYLCRLFVKAGASVRVVMTPAATSFISPVTLSTLSRNQVQVSITDDDQWNDHVAWGLWADLFIVAPVTATTLAKMASGIADNMLLATYLSARCKCLIAPAMDLDMWKHPSTRRNLQLLQSDGVDLIDVGDGELASGLVGPGRMSEPDEIFSLICRHFERSKIFKGKKVLITAGPTVEKIDPVRFITNHSTGRMGIELAHAFVRSGATVQVVHGPLKVAPPKSPSISLYPVETAREMERICDQLHPNCDIAAFTAAVSDYRPKTAYDKKIKKGGQDNLSIEFERNPDIAAICGKRKKADQYHLGFALETDNEQENASKKLREKYFDAIALNSLADEGAGFGHFTNKVSLISENKSVDLELKPKAQIAEEIVNFIAENYEPHTKP